MGCRRSALPIRSTRIKRTEANGPVTSHFMSAERPRRHSHRSRPGATAGGQEPPRTTGQLVSAIRATAGQTAEGLPLHSRGIEARRQGWTTSSVHTEEARSPRPGRGRSPAAPELSSVALNPKGREPQLWGLKGPRDRPRPEPLAPRLCLSLMCELCQETVCCPAPQSTQTV